MLLVRKAAVLGAGVMGSSIAAHLANCGIPTLLLDMAPREISSEESAKGLSLESPEVRNRFALKGLALAKKSGLAHGKFESLITAGNFDDDLEKLTEVDWVIEAVVEKMEIKSSLLNRVSAHLHKSALLTTNTSGLSINGLADKLPEDLRPRFFGTHFFNPPRYMYLLEVIPSRHTPPETVGLFSDFASRKLGKGVVLGKDSPNFIANRIGIFSTVYTMGIMQKHGLTIEEADAVTGKALGRAKSATFGTSDLAGVDLLADVVATQYNNSPNDEVRELNKLPSWVMEMIGRGLHGNKVGAGFYKDKRKLVLDPETFEYRPLKEPNFESLNKAKAVSDAGSRIAGILKGDDAAARFAWDLLSQTLIYAANRVGEVCDSLDGVDRAMKWGFAWEIGPFEIWDAIGLVKSVERMKGDGLLVPQWILSLAGSSSPFFRKAGPDGMEVWNPALNGYEKSEGDRRAVNLASSKSGGATILENKAAALVDLGDGVACLEFKTKMNTMTEEVMEFTRRVLDIAGTAFDALVVGNQGPVFSAGANLSMMREKIVAKDFAGVEKVISDAQATMAALKFAPVPIVAAPFGKALGGGLEFVLHCHRSQTALETSMGLVELGVGLLPAAGGVKESLLRAMDRTGCTGAPTNQTLLAAFEPIAGARVSRSAFDAYDLGFLTPCDLVTINKDHLLYEAKTAALALLNCGWRPLAKRKVPAAGRDGLGFLYAVINNMAEGGYLSPYDAVIAAKVARVLCGGEVESGTIIDEQFIFDLEREAFLSLCGEERTLARIDHMLNTGKPLRN